ncbi:Protein of unknown function [Thermoflavimicrobium dichotomicum]|uniref:Uncharacterized protein n=2 Tax=Thermoflavimicrobium dichotomicum TaxID=46223 RepID=A0A1I3MI00_9BACL|nr:DUF1700 domain-containing protein [Thermoflavimicrobium dichotomicum]SFI96390.1 Protein of unknown function [Thermoflavimicrobium dichotomicum]
MGPNARTYLDTLAGHLKNLPIAEKEDILKEIESHILSGLEHGQSEDEILKRLGDPKTLATGYTGEYFLKQKTTSPRLFFHKLLFSPLSVFSVR